MLSTRKALLLGAALVLGSAQGASAADLYGGGSIKDAPIMEPMPAASSGWYLRVDGGRTWYTEPTVNVTDFTVTNENMDSTWSLGGGIGYYFGRGFRGDITVDHVFDADVTGSLIDSCGCAFGDAKTTFDSTVVLANLYYDFNRGGRFTPYIGAGIGFARNHASSGTVVQGCECVAEFDGGSQTSFAAAAMAGISWKIRGGETTYLGGIKDGPVAVNSGRGLYLDVGYRFLYLGDVKTGDLVFNVPDTEPVDPKIESVTAHELRVGLRYDLN